MGIRRAQRMIVRLVPLLAFATFTLASVLVPAKAEEVVNGNFDSGAISWLTGLSQHNMVGNTIDGQTALTSTGSTLQKNEFQYINAALLSDGSANPNWTSGASSETFKLSFQYDIAGAPTASTDFILYSYNPTTVAGPPRTGSSYQYAPGSLQNPLSSFTVLYNSGLLGATNGWVTVDVPLGTVTGPNLDPQWFCIYMDAKDTTGTVAFDSISLCTQSGNSQTGSPAVPEPSSIILGMLGLTTICGKGFGKYKKA